jgi:hypothetical protein
MKVEIRITGEGLGPIEPMVANILECASEAGLNGARADFRYGRVESRPPMFYTGGPRDIPTTVEDAVEMSVSFASIVSARLADEHDLDVTDFEGCVPSGKRGFTVDDVAGLVALRGS